MKALPALLLFAALAAQADDGISPDRPDFTNGPDVVGTGRFQIEASGAWQRTRADGSSTRLRSTPTLLRLGVSETFELRLDSDGALRQSNPDASGRGDLGLGFKWQLREGSASQPGLAWLFDLRTPSGSGPFRGQGLRPSLSFLSQWQLPAGYSLGTMAGLLVDRDDANQRYTAGQLSASLGVPVAEGLHGFLEVAGQQLAAARHGGKVVTAGTGLAYALSSDAQLDTAVFRGLNHDTPDWAWTVGLSLRY